MKTNSTQGTCSRLTAAILAAVISATAYGISITPAQPGAAVTYDPDENYVFAGQSGIVRLDPLSVTLLGRGGTPGLLNLLTDFAKPVVNGGGGWTFQTAAQDLNGSFNVKTYDADSPTTRPGVVGATFVMDYVTAAGDPQGVIWHWIQRVFNNHDTTGAHGVNGDLIDATRTSALTDPGRLFYDFDVNFATPPHFEDSPGRGDPLNNHQWHAELYLASIPAVGSKTVTIYNGVSWGWTNTVPESGETIMLIAISLVCLAWLHIKSQLSKAKQPGC